MSSNLPEYSQHNIENEAIELENQPDGKGWRFKTHEIIFGHHTFAGYWFDLALLLAISVSIIVICVETVPEFQNAKEWFIFAEVAFTILFAIEYGLRIWCVKNPLEYAFSFFGIVDLLAIIPSVIGLSLFFFHVISTNEIASGTGSYAVIRSLRLLRVFRLMRIGKLEKESSELATAVWKARAKVVVFLLTVVITVIIAGTLMYEIEGYNDPNGKSQFHSIPEGIYWAIVTMTTVGYGDIVPQTILGRLVSSLLILIGYSLIIVPTGFVSAEVIGQRQFQFDSKRKCDKCNEVGHDKRANYCKICGEKFKPEDPPNTNEEE